MREAVLKSVKEFLLEKLEKYNPINGSEYRDISYINFSNMIRIDLSDHEQINHIHIDVTYDDNNEVVVIIYFANNNKMSYKFWDTKVDIAAPNFGRLWETVDEFLQKWVSPKQQVD